jgi:glycosyltransferase involved in cell wall biosynthesis
VDQNCGIKIPLANKKQMVNDLAQAIDTFTSDGDKRQVMGHNAQLRVRQEFIWDVVVGRMLKVYEEVMSEDKR